MVVRREKWEALRLEMEKLEIFEADLKERFVTGQGRGGQKLQKTASSVFLKHLPTGLTVKSQRSRLREDNRYFARRELCTLYSEKILKLQTPRMKERDKRRKQKKRRERRSSSSEK